jgi:hypothetical protein
MYTLSATYPYIHSHILLYMINTISDTDYLPHLTSDTGPWTVPANAHICTYTEAHKTHPILLPVLTKHRHYTYMDTCIHTYICIHKHLFYVYIYRHIHPCMHMWSFYSLVYQIEIVCLCVCVWQMTQTSNSMFYDGINPVKNDTSVCVLSRIKLACMGRVRLSTHVAVCHSLQMLQSLPSSL